MAWYKPFIATFYKKRSRVVYFTAPLFRGKNDPASKFVQESMGSHEMIPIPGIVCITMVL